MKSLARNYVWWPNIDKSLEEKVKSCVSCQGLQKNPRCSPLHPWEWPGRPWSQVHVDYASPFMGKTSLVITDAQSQWVLLNVMSFLHLLLVFAVKRGNRAAMLGKLLFFIVRRKSVNYDINFVLLVEVQVQNIIISTIRVSLATV